MRQLLAIIMGYFIEDLELHLNLNIESGLNYEDLTIILFLYADDMVLMAENINDMQQSLDIG